MPDLWDQESCDCLICSGYEFGITRDEMYVVRGDTWIVSANYVTDTISLRQETLENAILMFRAKVRDGWKISHMSDAWKSLSNYPDLGPAR